MFRRFICACVIVLRFYRAMLYAERDNAT